MYCSQCFRYEKTLNNHKENCITINGAQARNCITINGAQAIKIPKADDMIYFKTTKRD